MMDVLREVKPPEEITLLKKAVRTFCDGHQIEVMEGCQTSNVERGFREFI